jgi:glutamate synthase domain-containing protein 3
LNGNQIFDPIGNVLTTSEFSKICANTKCQITDHSAKIDVSGLHYRDLNEALKNLIKNKVTRISLNNVHGQRYIGTSLKNKIEITINGTAGNDLGAFMDGPEIHVYGNAQDGCGNTVNSGEIVVHGSTGDITGYAMRGGRLFIKGSVGYRAGIHMKEYGENQPTMVIGETAGDFLAEYMAGGTIVLLGLNLEKNQSHRSLHVGTGMHSGRIYVHGKITGLGKEAVIQKLDEQDCLILKPLLSDFCKHFGYDKNHITDLEFYKIIPNSERPYGRLYAY